MLPLPRGDHGVGQHRAAPAPGAPSSCSACPCRRPRRGRRPRRSARRPSPADPGWCRPRPTVRAAAGRPRRPRRASAAPTTARARRARLRPSSLVSATDRLGAVDLGQLPPGPIASRSGSPDSRTQRPSCVMPTGTTSYRSGSIAFRTLPAVTHEMACSLERPPKTTATRGRFGVVSIAPRTLPGRGAGADDRSRSVEPCQRRARTARPCARRPRSSPPGGRRTNPTTRSTRR